MSAPTIKTPLEIVASRFWPRVAISGLDECWPWKASIGSGGYGQMRDPRLGRPVPASRIAWELVRGPIVGGLHVLHHCDNKPCCNPLHLFLGTHADNMRDAWQKGLLTDLALATRRLTVEQVREIRNKVAEGMSQTSVGKEYGVHQTCIGMIVHGRRWNGVK